MIQRYPLRLKIRHLADDEGHLTDPAARFAGIVVGIVNAASVVIFNVAQHTGSRRAALLPG